MLNYIYRGGVVVAAAAFLYLFGQLLWVYMHRHSIDEYKRKSIADVTGVDAWQVQMIQLLMLLVVVMGFFMAWQTGMEWRQDLESKGCSAFCSAKVGEACGIGAGKQLTRENGTWKYTYTNQTGRGGFNGSYIPLH